MSNPNFPGQFAAKAAKVKSGIPSTTNWHGVRNLLAEELGVAPQAIYVSTISKVANVSVRFFQSKAVFRASVLVAMHTGDPETVPGTVKAMQAIAAERGASAVVATPEERGEWSIVAILRPSGDASLEALAEAYPDAVMVPV
jgi:hypothetical protein